MIKAYKNFWLKTFDLKTVSSRTEFWWSTLVNALLWMIFISVGYFVDVISIIDCVLAIIFLIPSISIIIRRLHDTGRSGFNIFWIFAPVVGLIFLTVYLLDKTYEEN